MQGDEKTEQGTNVDASGVDSTTGSGAGSANVGPEQAPAADRTQSPTTYSQKQQQKQRHIAADRLNDKQRSANTMCTGRQAARAAAALLTVPTSDGLVAEVQDGEHSPLKGGYAKDGRRSSLAIGQSTTARL